MERLSIDAGGLFKRNNFNFSPLIIYFCPVQQKKSEMENKNALYYQQEKKKRSDSWLNSSFSIHWWIKSQLILTTGTEQHGM